MDQDQLDAFRHSLISLRDEIEQLSNANKDAASTVKLDQSTVGRLSRIDAMQAQQMAQETTRRRKIQSQRIESALRRMDAGEYGYCLKCGNAIEAARLGFDPANTRCIECMDN